MRRLSIAQMRQNAVNARAMLQLKKGEIDNLNRQKAEYEFLGQQAPSALTQKINQLTTQMGQLAATGAGQLHQAQMGQHFVGAGTGAPSPLNALVPKPP